MAGQSPWSIGIDIGSTTIKAVVLDKDKQICFSHYERHFSQINEKVKEMLNAIDKQILKGAKASLMVSGSAGLGLADRAKLPFIQEVHPEFLEICT